VKTTFCAALVSLVAPLALAAQRPVALADSDLGIAPVVYRADSIAVQQILGRPKARAVSSWTYDGLRVWFKNGKVEQFALTSRHFATRRGLRVGDSVSRVVQLYGPSCTEGAYNYCRTVGDDPDSRGMLVEISNGRVTQIRIGAVFDLD
jgi:hypothetical protein